MAKIKYHLDKPIILALLALSMLLPAPGLAGVEEDDKSQLAQELNIPLCQWRDPTVPCEGVIVAVHGLIKHGSVYDTLARHLAERGFVVVAPDMRGYGHWCDADRSKSEHQICYGRSYQDLVSLTERLHDLYPDKPVFLIGESLGADMSIHLAGEHPELTSGLILSSPAIRHYHKVLGSMITDTVLACTNPSRQLDMIPFIKFFCSNDPRILNESLNDPMERKSLSIIELFKSRSVMKKTLRYAKEIPPTMPVLIIQGSKDRLIKSNSVFLLVSNLHSTDQTVRWLDQKGHVLLETAFVQPQTINTIERWLKQHMPSSTVYQALIKSKNFASVETD